MNPEQIDFDHSQTCSGASEDITYFSCFNGDAFSELLVCVGSITRTQACLGTQCSDGETSGPSEIAIARATYTDTYQSFQRCEIVDWVDINGDGEEEPVFGWVEQCRIDEYHRSSCEYDNKRCLWCEGEEQMSAAVRVPTVELEERSQNTCDDDSAPELQALGRELLQAFESKPFRESESQLFRLLGYGKSQAQGGGLTEIFDPQPVPTGNSCVQ